MLLFSHNLTKEEPGFTVVDTEARISAYAPPTSIWCNIASHSPETVAREMIAFAETQRHDIPHIAWDDNRRLGIMKAALLTGGDCGACEREA